MTCSLCPVSRAVCNPLLRNNGTGDILIVVSEPDKRDDLDGVLYTSRNGKVLKELLKDAGIDSYTITGATRCAPTTYLKGDPEQCRTHLIPLIQSKPWTAIIAMGNIALKTLTKKSGIKKWRGKAITIHNSYGITREVFATYGVEEFLESPTYRNIMVRDLRNSLEKGEPDAVEFVRWKHGESPWRE